MRYSPLSRRLASGVLLALFLAASAEAQVVLPDARQQSLQESVFGLGLFAGPLSGAGLSFRHHLPSPLSYQITGGIIKVSEKLSYAVGIEVQYDLVHGTQTRFFVVGGVGYYYAGKNGNQMEGPARAGLGVGGELEIGSGFHMTGEAVFTYFSDGTILPLPQVGIYYYFY